MEPRALTLTDYQRTEHPAPNPGLPTAGLPVEGLEQIWALFPEARPGDLPAEPAHAAVGLPTDEAYMARVYDLVRREEALQYLRAQYQQAALTPVPAYPQVMAAAPTHLLPPAAPAAPQRAVPTFVWKYSAIALSTGGGIALAGVGVGAAAPTLAQLPAILTATGQAVMSATGLFVLIFLALAVRGASRGSGGGGTTVNIRKAVFRRNKFHG
ncbi:hypothetical protein F610DRAFT_06828 [Streptomyces sp. LaPpAH-199]|uniref:hypothetical protein n=1 Tax=Streptomyces TaxID=1883 RepID=UPI000886EC64|nr:hypothetical protein [Streptomyces sp. LaPpAH-199]MYW77698.1 hypothetical protein [Streptomyces sp. SID8369]SDE32601.1 hypothetical protein F610DRAFT_06828 [Streptomyces sp. LaPpAH-199]